MSEPLTAERFEKFEEHFDAFVETYTANHAEVVKCLEKLDDVSASVKRIEKHLWNEQRLEEHERRLIELAATVGRADLATPFTRPIGG